MISPIGEVKGNRAFSLIEILLVIVIAGVVLALAAPNFSKGYSRLQLDQTADDLLRVSRWAQAMAIGQGRTYALFFERDRRSYRLVRVKSEDESGGQDDFEPVKGSLGRMHQVPEAIRLDSLDDHIEFYPDGTIGEAAISLSSSDKKIELSSAPVRGMITKVESE